MLVPLKDALDRGGDAGLELHRALSAWHQVPVRLLDPAGPGLRESFRDVGGTQPLPLAEIDLAQRHLRRGLSARGGRDGLRGFESALQVAGVKAGKPPAGEPLAEAPGLLASLRGERGVELALDSPFPVPRRLPVADEQQARRPQT